MPRDRGHSRERSPVPHTSKDSRKYRDRSDRPTKRKHREASEDATAPAKKIQLAVQNRKENNYPSVNELKRRVRDVKRLLNRGDLPADVRIVQERALSGYEKDLEDEMQRRDRSQMIKKYHFVRFLDRKSATKNLNRLLRHEKETTNATDINLKTKEKALQSLRPKIHTARVNLNYTIYYPLNDKYISLYAEQNKQKKGPDSGTDNQTDDEDTRSRADEKTTITETPPMWHTVEKCMEDGTLDLLREGKLGEGEKEEENPAATKKQKMKSTARSSTSQDSKKSTEKTTTTSRTKSKRSDDDDRKGNYVKRGATKDDVTMQDYDNGKDDDESDGGFFE